MRYVFTKTISANTPTGENRHFKAGDEIDEAEIEGGCLESCKRNQTLVLAPEPVAKEEGADQAADAEAQAPAPGDAPPEQGAVGEKAVGKKKAKATK